jgi:hypothetical protein
MIWCISSICILDAPAGPRRNHSSSFPDIFRVEVVIIFVYCASLPTRRPHDTAYFIQNSLKSVFHDEISLFLCLE